MKQKAIILLILLTEIFSISKFFACTQFLQQFSAFDLSLRLIEGIHADKGQPILITRIFHNKILYALLDIFNLYMQYFNISFLAGFISLAGLVGTALGVYYFLVTKRRSWYAWPLPILILLVPFVGIFNFGTKETQICIVALPFILFSLYGYYEFLKMPGRSKYLLVIFIILISLWIVAANGNALKEFCPAN